MCFPRNAGHIDGDSEQCRSDGCDDADNDLDDAALWEDLDEEAD